jgi:hypothetical protein
VKRVHLVPDASGPRALLPQSPSYSYCGSEAEPSASSGDPSWVAPLEVVRNDFLAPDAAVRMIEDQPAVVGRKAIADVFKSFMTTGVTLTIETLETTVSS